MNIHSLSLSDIVADIPRQRRSVRVSDRSGDDFPEVKRSEDSSEVKRNALVASVSRGHECVAFNFDPDRTKLLLGAGGMKR